MSPFRALAIGSSLGWFLTTLSMAAIGMANVGTLAAGALPVGLWTLALVAELLKGMKSGADKTAPVED